MELVTITILLMIYFIPALIGSGHRNSKAIFVLNLFAGWTMIGWLASLVWALSK